MLDVASAPAEPVLIHPKRSTALFAWQGWQLRVPAEWSPLRLEGDFARGSALLADLDGPRLGLRWQAMEPARATPEALERICIAEAACESVRHARGAIVGVGSQPAGREVALRWSADSARIVQLSCHARDHDGALIDELLASLADVSARPERPWAVFDLSCVLPRAMQLSAHRLDAGDLSLRFAGPGRFATIRQIALAHAALRRQPIESWLAALRQDVRSRCTDEPRAITFTTRDGRRLQGLIGHSRRRRRFFWCRATPVARTVLALHDASRDRLVLIEGSDDALARDLAVSSGCGSD